MASAAVQHIIYIALALAISRVNLDHVSEKKKSEVEKNYAEALFGHLFWVIESPYES